MNYTDDLVYMELANLCEQAGFSIAYTNLSSDIIGRAKDRSIQMPNENVFESDSQAGLTLAHEMVHLLMDNVYSSCETELSQHILIESDCDRMGVIVYKLAEEIAGHKAERRLIDGR